MVLEDSDLASSEDSFEREPHEKFCCRGEESAEGVSGRCEDGVDTEC